MTNPAEAILAAVEIQRRLEHYDRLIEERKKLRDELRYALALLDGRGFTFTAKEIARLTKAQMLAYPIRAYPIEETTASLEKDNG